MNNKKPKITKYCIFNDCGYSFIAKISKEFDHKANLQINPSDGFNVSCIIYASEDNNWNYKCDSNFVFNFYSISKDRIRFCKDMEQAIFIQKNSILLR